MYDNDADETLLHLKSLLSLMISKMYIIILLAALGAACMFFKVKYFTTDCYVSEGALVVSNITEEVLSQKAYLTSSDMESSKSLSKSCMELLQRRGFFDMVSKDTGGKYSYSQIAKMVTIVNVNETEVLSVTVKANDKEDAYAVCNSIIKNAPSWIESIYDLGVVKKADDASMPQKPVSKNVARNIFVGFMLGAIAGAAIIFVIDFFDDKVKCGEEISRKYGFPLLGELDP